MNEITNAITKPITAYIKFILLSGFMNIDIDASPGPTTTNASTENSPKNKPDIPAPIITLPNIFLF